MVDSKTTDKLRIISDIITNITKDETFKQRIKKITVEWKNLESDITDYLAVPDLVIEMKD